MVATSGINEDTGTIVSERNDGPCLGAQSLATSLCRILPFPAKQEIRDRPDEIDERYRGPHFLAAVDLVGRATADIDERRYQQTNLDSGQHYRANFLHSAHFAPLLGSNHDLLLLTSVLP